MLNSVLNTTVSAFKDYNTPTNPKYVNLLSWLTSNKFADKVITIREEKDKGKRDAIKIGLPAITPSGLFDYRRESNLIKHSGLIQVDIDFKENSHIYNYHELKLHLRKIVNVAYCGLSVSGTGYFLLIPIAYTDKHKEHFDYIYDKFKQLGIIIDSKPRNVASLRGYSYDPEAYFNHNANILVKYLKRQLNTQQKTYRHNGNTIQAQVENLINTISKKGIDIASNYNQWLSVGFALAEEFGEAGRQYFHDISQVNDNYDCIKTNTQYDYCLKSNGKGITIRTLFHLCKQSGISLLGNEKIDKAQISSNPYYYELLKDGRYIELTKDGYPKIWDTVL